MRLFSGITYLPMIATESSCECSSSNIPPHSGRKEGFDVPPPLRRRRRLQQEAKQRLGGGPTGESESRTMTHCQCHHWQWAAVGPPGATTPCTAGSNPTYLSDRCRCWFRVALRPRWLRMLRGCGFVEKRNFKHTSACLCTFRHSSELRNRLREVLMGVLEVCCHKPRKSCHAPMISRRNVIFMCNSDIHAPVPSLVPNRLRVDA